MNIEPIKPFGTTPSGDSVYLITLHDDKVTCEIITFGATIRSLIVPDRHGKPVDIVLGYDNPEQYWTEDAYLGATVGRCANRIAGGKFTLNDKTYTLAANNGNNHLHGGLIGFSHRVWEIESVKKNSTTLSLTSPNGEEGYPGNLQVRVTFTLHNNSLSIQYHAVSDMDTICNLTNHSYFNLSGHNSGKIDDQILKLYANTYTPSDAENIPYGTIEPVFGTPMDFTKETAIGSRINESFPQLLQARGYDHNYVIDGHNGDLRPAAYAYSKKTGISMLTKTTMSGVHLYTANFVEDGLMGKLGASYGPRHAFCLETQYFPNAINETTFIPPILKKNDTYNHTTVFTFKTDHF